MLHFEAHFPHLRHWYPTPSIVILKLIWLTLVLGMVDIILQKLPNHHPCCVLARVRLTTFWSFRLYTAVAFSKIRACILAWSWCWGPFIEVEGLLGLAFFPTKPCTSFKCLINNHLAQYATMQVPTLHFHFDPTFVHSLSFRGKLGGQGVADGWETWSV
jgi:hypothetical protein